MRLTEAQSRELLANHNVFVTEACDKCGKLLGHIRFTHHGEPGEWCSRECREGAESTERHGITRKGGRPRKYRTDGERQAAERQQHAIRQQAYRRRRSVTENPLTSDSLLDAKETKFFQHQGVIMETREVEALGIQARVAIALMEAADAAARDEADRNSDYHRPGQVTVNMVVSSADDAKEIMDFLARLSSDRERPLLDAARDENKG